MANVAPVEITKSLCTVCEGDGVSSEAFSFCYNCDRVFCVDCNKTHTKFTLDHKVVVGEDNIRRVIDEKRSFVPCEVHSKENLDFYCRDHEVALCNVCKHTAHRKCNVEKLSLVLEDVDIAEWNGQISKRVKDILENTGKIDHENVLLKQNLDQNADKMKNKIEHIRTELNGVLDRYIEKLETQYIDKSDVIANNRQVCKGIGEHLGNREDALERSKGNRVKEILTMMETKKLCKDYEYSLEEIQPESVLAEIIISEDDRVPSLIQDISSVAYQDIADSDEASEVKIAKSSRSKSFLNIKNCSFVKENDIPMINGYQIPKITGCCFLPDDRVVICDNANNTIQFLDKNMNVKYNILCSGPWDVDCVKDDCIAVTLPSDRSLQLIIIRPGIKLDRIHKVCKKGYGIAVNNDEIILAISDTRLEDKKTYMMNGVQILNKNYNQLAFYEYTGSGSPMCVCTNEDGSKIYYSGGVGVNRFVICITNSGYALYSVCTTPLYSPRHMICDGGDNLLVCDVGTKSIHTIDSDGVVGDVVISFKDVLVPMSMCFNKHSDMLVVASQTKTESKLTMYIS